MGERKAEASVLAAFPSPTPSTRKESSPPSKKNARKAAGAAPSTNQRMSKGVLNGGLLIDFPRCFSYFNQSSSGSEDGEGESEDAIRQRISKEFGFNEPVTGKGREQREEGEEEEEEDDPLEAFMAGIEVSNQYCEHVANLSSYALVCSI